VKRPKSWTPSEELTIHPVNYKMGWVHRFICKSIKGSSEIKNITIKKRMRELTGYCGFCLFENDAIIIAQDITEREQYISIFHEIFHYYFRDYYDNRIDEERNGINDEKKDSVEERAENSALNLLQWYLTNSLKFKEFNYLFNKIQVSMLTKQELKDLI